MCSRTAPSAEKPADTRVTAKLWPLAAALCSIWALYWRTRFRSCRVSSKRVEAAISRMRAAAFSSLASRALKDTHR